ncbi:MAG: hypothetical protein LBV62_00670, partial [Rickettsiales bacterium]|nr:hypothetical protein [Rickettsiales bacterium]
KTVLLYLPWVTSSIFFVFVEFTLLSCLFYSLFNPELALQLSLLPIVYLHSCIWIVFWFLIKVRL